MGNGVSKSVEKYGLSYIRPYHREIARRLVLGQKPTKIREEVGMSDSRFSIIVNSPLFKIEIRRLEGLRDEGVADVTKTLVELSPIALEVVERTMYTAKSETLRASMAESILDRAGFGKTSRVGIDVKGSIGHHSLTEDELRKLVMDRVERMKTGMEAKAKEVKDAESFEVTFDKVDEIDEGCPDFGHKKQLVNLMLTE